MVLGYLQWFILHQLSASVKTDASQKPKPAEAGYECEPDLSASEPTTPIPASVPTGVSFSFTEIHRVHPLRFTEPIFFFASFIPPTRLFVIANAWVLVTSPSCHCESLGALDRHDAISLVSHITSEIASSLSAEHHQGD
jgi:hypothetical protein